MVVSKYSSPSRAFLLFCLKFGLVCADKSEGPVATSYDVVLRPDLNNLTFYGEVTIGVSTFKTESKLKLMARGLNVMSADVKYGGVMSVRETHSAEIEHGRLTIRVDNLIAGNHTITLTFQGLIDDRGVGLFLSVCRSQGFTSWLGGGILWPVHVSSVFPTFGFSENQVPLNLQLVLDQDFRTVTPVPASSSVAGGLQTVVMHFDRIYLHQLGFAFFPEDVSGGERQEGVVSCRPGTWGSATKTAAEAWGNYTGLEAGDTQWVLVPDLPSPFVVSKGITFIREHLLEDSSYVNSVDYSENLLKITEAYGQQLFSQNDRVGAWTDVWLTRGLANFLSYKLTEKVDGNFQSESYIVGQVLPRVMERETIPHSLSRHTHSGQDVLALLDQDLCDKGGLIMRMLEDQVGENAFRRSVQHFLSKPPLNASDRPDHFWNSLKANSLDFPEESSVHEVTKAWVNSAGYPVLTVRRHGDHLHITQDSIVEERGEGRKGWWWVPLTLTSETLRGPRKFWLRPRASLKINLPLHDKWYMINENAKGLYRVNYDEENWGQLLEAATRKELGAVARGRLLDDSLALAAARRLPYHVALQLTRLLAAEFSGGPDLTPWSAARRHLVAIRSLLDDRERPHFEEYAATLIKFYLFGDSVSSNSSSVEMLKASYEEIDNTVNSTDMSRTDMDLLISKLWQTKELCRDNSYCAATVDSVASYVAAHAYSVENTSEAVGWLLAEGGASRELMDSYKQFRSPTLEARILRSVSCVSNSSETSRFLNMFIEESSLLKRQDFVSAIAEMSYSEESVKNIMDWINTYQSQVYRYFSGDPSMVSQVLILLSEKIYSENGSHKLSSLVEDLGRRMRLDEHQVGRALFRVKSNRRRRHTDSDQIGSWLRNPHLVQSSTSRHRVAFLLMLASFLSSLLLNSL